MHQKIKNIIFDLGGVIININPQITIQKFKALGIHNIEKTYKSLMHINVFKKYEIGHILTEEFISSLKKTSLNDNIKTSEIKDAWNSMLRDLPLKRIDLLKKLKKRYHLFLLSNTNELHIEAFNNYLHHTLQISMFETLFKNIYYSHEIHMRKPDDEVFEYVMSENKLQKEETLFIDDREDNIITAEKLGINTLHIKNGMELTEVMKDY
ncbi:HAD family hydrolase [Bacteroidota bacterium]